MAWARSARRRLRIAIRRRRLAQNGALALASASTASSSAARSTKNSTCRSRKRLSAQASASSPSGPRSETRAISICPGFSRARPLANHATGRQTRLKGKRTTRRRRQKARRARRRARYRRRRPGRLPKAASSPAVRPGPRARLAAAQAARARGRPTLRRRCQPSSRSAHGRVGNLSSRAAYARCWARKAAAAMGLQGPSGREDVDHRLPTQVPATRRFASNSEEARAAAAFMPARGPARASRRLWRASRARR